MSELLDDFNSIYHELCNKLQKNESSLSLQNSDLVSRYYLLIKSIKNIKNEMEQMIIEIDKNSLRSLTSDELNRIENDEIIDRVSERIMPFITLGLMIESLDSQK